MTREECIWHTKTKLRLIFRGNVLLISSFVFTCLMIPNPTLVGIGVLGMLLGLGSLIYGTHKDD